jgi:hypothetical protein
VLAFSLVRTLGSILLVASVPCFAACGGTPRAEPSAGAALAFEHAIDGGALVLGQTAKTRYGQSVRFDSLRYWVSNVAFRRGDATFPVPHSFHLVEQTKSRERLEVKVAGLPPGRYDGLVLHLGVDPAHNASLDVLDGELQPNIGMDWGWDTGYKFFRTEGAFTDGAGSGTFTFHTGSNVLYKRLEVAFPEPVELSLDAYSPIAIRAEVDRIFAGVPLDGDTEILGGPIDSAAAQVAGNVARMFRLVTTDGVLPFTVSAPNVDAAPPDAGVPSDATPPALTASIVSLPDGLHCGAVPGRLGADARGCVTPFLWSPTSASPFDAGLATFVVPNAAPVFAASPGLVWDVRNVGHSELTHSDVFDVIVRPQADSAFFLEYRNLKDVSVAEGAPVVAGQRLGGAGDYLSESVGVVSFGVRRAQERTQRLCPTTFASSAWSSAFMAGLAKSNAAWPAFAHDAACTGPSLLCTGEACDAPADFVPVGGDVDAGRRTYKSACASCHGDAGQGGIAGKFCKGPGCSCASCGDHASLAARIDADMPPEGQCDATCANDVAAYILAELAKP